MGATGGAHVPFSLITAVAGGSRRAAPAGARPCHPPWCGVEPVRTLRAGARHACEPVCALIVAVTTPEPPDVVEADHYFSRSGRSAQAQPESPFTIEVRFTGGLTERQRAAFTAAADRWTQVIVGDLPPVEIDGEVVDDVLILAEGADIDGTGRVLGQAGPTHLRPESAGSAALLPARGEMTFDSADLAALEADGSLDDVITHEMGHVLGIGTLWDAKGLLAGSGTDDPTFTGTAAVAEYAALGGTGDVPVENTGGPGTAEGHWREARFATELMTGFLDQGTNPLSRMTAASLGDLGYDVDLDATEPYALPGAATADRTASVRRLARCAVTVPAAVVLPDSSLRGRPVTDARAPTAVE
jgi:hypothetical protein